MFALVTGASGGIGREITGCLIKKGYTVIAHYNKNEKSIVELTDLYGDRIIPAKCNFSNTKETDLFSKSLAHSYKNIEVIINNAGIAYQGVIDEMSYQSTMDLLNINLASAVITTRNLVKNMISLKKGSIINISSIWGSCGGSCEVVYSAAKGGLISFTKALSKELGPSGIRVNCLSLGFIDTEMNKNISDEDKKIFADELSLQRIGTPNDVIGAVEFLISKNASYITGQIIGIDGGF